MAKFRTVEETRAVWFCTTRCAYTHCNKLLPGPYGTPGVAMSRFDNKTNICSVCGQREALEPRMMQMLKSF